MSVRHFYLPCQLDEPLCTQPVYTCEMVRPVTSFTSLSVCKTTAYSLHVTTSIKLKHVIIPALHYLSNSHAHLSEYFFYSMHNPSKGAKIFQII